MLTATDPTLDLTQERARCTLSYTYFADTYVQIYDTAAQAWIPFHLWRAQAATLDTVHRAARVVIMKSRQLGLSWLMLTYILWGMLFRPVFTALVFSKREEEAKYLLGRERLQGMYSRLPAWLQVPSRDVSGSTEADAATDPAGGMKSWSLVNDSTVTAFPANGGDGRTAAFALVDEFDLLDSKEQNGLLTAVQPAVEHGTLVLLSKVNKKEPNSPFKRIYEGAVLGNNGWTPVFLPWTVRPGRDSAWYAATAAEIQTRTGGIDELYENYPATDSEALLPPQLVKRLSGEWLLAVQAYSVPLQVPDAPAITGLTVWAAPVPGVAYCIGGDPAEGNPGSDASTALVVRVDTGVPVAKLKGLIEPTPFAGYMAQIALWYNGAAILPERNNHGHAVIAPLLAWVPRLQVLKGTDGKPGWLTTPPSKAALYDNAATLLKAGDCRIADPETFHQLASIDGNTLNAPPGRHDDDAMAWVLAQRARALARPSSVYVP